MPNLEQQYAATIYKQISDYPGRFAEDSPERKRYGSMAHMLPILVRQAGLAQALAFVQSRRKEPYNKLLEHLTAAVGETDLLAASRQAELSEYIYLTERVMLALRWYKRFAQSVLKVDMTDQFDDRGGQ
ncbi:MAG: type III-B CRISPR module-associated protein Cmr5 [Anaerolineae bacterium]